MLTFKGPGVHSNKIATLTIHPGKSPDGIVFKREGELIPAKLNYVKTTLGCTTLGNEKGITVSTVEHLLSALSAANIWSALIEIDGPEVPILDGGALTFWKELLPYKDLYSKEPFSITEKVEVSEGKSYAYFEPSPFRSFHVDLEMRGITQSFTYGHDDYTKIAPARTFGFFEDAETLRAKGFALGATLENTCVLKDGKAMNPSGLHNECARHKILDAMGDLALFGRPIMGAFYAKNPSHTLNVALLKKLSHF